MAGFSASTYALCRVYTDKAIAGGGAIKGSPCTIKSVVPTYSTADSSKVLYNTVTFEWTLSDGTTKQTQAMKVNNGNGIVSITYRTTSGGYHYYDVLYLDATTETMVVPVAAGSFKKKVVTWGSTLPNPEGNDPDTGLPWREDTFYLNDKGGSVYDQYIIAYDSSGAKTWLNLGSTETNLTAYQLKIDTTLIRQDYTNYDSETKADHPTYPNVVGALNEHELELNGLTDTTRNGTKIVYDKTNGILQGLNTYHKTSIVDAINDIGDLSKLEMWSSASQTPATLVDAINMANGSYSLDRLTTVDRTKNVDSLQLTRDPGDGSPKVAVGDEVDIPRVDVKVRATPESTDYRTYDVYEGGNTSDPKDTTGVAYGKIQIPQLKITKVATPSSTDLAAQYYLEIEGLGYDASRCGALIDIGKSQAFDDVTVKECTTKGVPVAELEVGDKYIDMQFTTPDGTEKHAYIPCKDLFDPYVGVKAISIAYNSTTAENEVSLKLYDPDSINALEQSNDGLKINKATETQYGVVEYATEAEVLKADTGTSKVIKPYDVYDFAKNSTAVKNDLQNFYKDPTTSETVNNTLIKALNELATITVEKLVTPDSGDYATYQVETLPTAGVKNVLGEKIHLLKTVQEVTSLTGVTAPNDYTIYYLTTDEGDNKSGLYMYVNSAWQRVDFTEAIIRVASLPTTDILDTQFYEVQINDTVNGRYTLSTSALATGWRANNQGMTLGTTTIYWDDVLNHWTDYYNDELVDSADGEIWSVTDTKTSVTSLKYKYKIRTHDLYYHVNDTWYPVSQTLTNYDIDADLNDIYNIDAPNFKRQTANEEDYGFVVQSDGTWKVNYIKQYKSVDSLSGILNPNSYTFYWLTTAETIAGKLYPASLYLYDGSDYVQIISDAVIQNFQIVTEIPTTHDRDTVYWLKDDEVDATGTVTRTSGIYMWDNVTSTLHEYGIPITTAEITGIDWVD